MEVSLFTPPPPPPPPTPNRHRKPIIRCNSTNPKKPVGFIDYNKGEKELTLHVTGIKKSGLTKRHRLKAESDKFQKDWGVTEVVLKIMKMDKYEDVDGVLNCWVGRFERKNFPILIREISQTGSLEHSNHVFKWMKNQKNYCARNDIYNMMIRLHARHNQTDQARGLFFEMQKWRCKPDAETYNALISAHGRAGQWRWATNIMEDMLRAAVCICILPLQSIPIFTLNLPFIH
ncbi:pentatricopeptide repeat-containing protein [Tanacetum coccineum]